MFFLEVWNCIYVYWIKWPFFLNYKERSCERMKVCKSCWPTVEVAQRLFQRLLVSNLLQLNNRCIHDVWYVTCSPAIGWRHHKTAWLPPTNNDHPTSQVATCLIFSVSYSLYINKTYQKQYKCLHVYIYIFTCTHIFCWYVMENISYKWKNTPMRSARDVITMFSHHKPLHPDYAWSQNKPCVAFQLLHLKSSQLMPWEGQQIYYMCFF